MSSIIGGFRNAVSGRCPFGRYRMDLRIDTHNDRTQHATPVAHRIRQIQQRSNAAETELHSSNTLGSEGRASELGFQRKGGV